MYIPFIAPATNTMAMVIKLTAVKILFKKLDSFTPNASNAASSKITPMARKSGYFAKKSTCIGMVSSNASDMLLSISASKYPLRPRATLAVPVRKGNI